LAEEFHTASLDELFEALKQVCVVFLALFKENS